VAKFGEGDAVTDFKWLLGLLIIIFIVWIYFGGPASFEQKNKIEDEIATTTSSEATTSKKSFLSFFSFKPLSTSKISIPTRSSSDRSTNSDSSSVVSSKKIISNSNRSPYYDQVTISTVRPHDRDGVMSEEYIILSASSRNTEPVIVSGWTIKNGKDQRYFEWNGKTYRGTSVSVKIPSAKLLVSKNYGSPEFSPVYLSPGGQVIVSSGISPNAAPTYRNGFLINKCTGYLRDTIGYAFYPSLSSSCPDPEKEAGFEYLARACQDFVSDLRACHIPKYTNDEDKGELVDGEKISSICKAYLAEHFNYEACVKNHRLDNNFYTKEWRVFLNQSWPLWDNKSDTISVYDLSGLLVAQKSY